VLSIKSNRDFGANDEDKGRVGKSLLVLDKLTCKSPFYFSLLYYYYIFDSVQVFHNFRWA